ncbi:hypothetical protein Droror1_Dr00011731 [Drosera rotundifolia]
MLDEAKNEIKHLKGDQEQRELHLVRCLKGCDEEKSLSKETSEKYATMLDDAEQEINNLKDEVLHFEEEHAQSKAEWVRKRSQLLNQLTVTEEEYFLINQEAVRIRGSLREVEHTVDDTEMMKGLFFR